MNYQRYYLVFFLICFFGACSTVFVPLESTVHRPKKEPASNMPTDEDLFLIGTSYLGGFYGVTPDYYNAKVAFNRLIENFPESKWQNPSKLFIALIDKIALMNKNTEAIKLLKDQMESEVERLRKENKQLKTELQHIKDLEIKLEKRQQQLR